MWWFWAVVAAVAARRLAGLMAGFAALTRPHGDAYGHCGRRSRATLLLPLDRTGVETVALAHGALGGTRVLRVEALGVLGVER